MRHNGQISVTLDMWKLFLFASEYFSAHWFENDKNVLSGKSATVIKDFECGTQEQKA